MNEVLRLTKSPWLASVLIAVATFASLWSLTPMVILDSWVARAAIALATTTLVVVISRLSSRSRILPPILGAVSAFLLLIALYAQNDEGRGIVLPTPEGVTALIRTIRTGFDQIAAAEFPTPVSIEIASLFTTGLLSVFLLAEFVAVSWRAVASAGLLLFTLWIPAIVRSQPVSTLALLIGLTSWIGAMTLSRKNAPAERGISLGTAAAATLASLAFVGLAAPAALEGQGWGSLDLDPPDLFDSPTRLDLDLDLRNSLDNNSESPILVYLSSGPRPDSFRLYTLSSFDGVGWDYSAPEPTDHPASDGLLWPESLAEWGEGELIALDVSVVSLTVNHLPIPTSPRTVEVEGNWTYDAGSDTIIGDNETTHNLAYSVTTDASFHTADALRATDKILDSDPDLDVSDPAMFEIPSAVDLEPIQTLAESLTEGRTTRYDKTLAIQNHLRNPSVFTYTTEVDPSPDDSVSAFLESKHGYCLQFATSMVVMLRSLGIPARLGYGFLAGSYDTESDGYIVRGKDAHVWPEVYFPTHGWVRFEPTPSIQTGTPPSWADPFGDTSMIPVPREVIEGGSYPVGTRAGSPVEPDDGPLTSEEGGPLVPAWVVRIIGVVAALGLLGVFIFWRRRTVAIERTFQGPEGAWNRLASRLGDLAWPASATPLEAQSWVVRGLTGLGGRPPSQQGSDALTALSTAVSDHRYAPESTDIPQHQLDSWVTDVINEAERALAEATDRPSRGAVQTSPRAGS